MNNIQKPRTRENMRCMYCGSEIEEVKGNNPNDYGLHDIPDEYKGKETVCCKYCDTITVVNRCFKQIIEKPEVFDYNVSVIEDVVKNFKKNKCKIMAHYSTEAAIREKMAN